MSSGFTPMARHPDWFERFDTVVYLTRHTTAEAFGRNEIRALFGCSQRDSIRLLHKFGATLLHDALSLPRSALLTQLEEIRSGSAYTAFLRQRQQVARNLAVARAEHVAHRHQIRGAAEFQYGKSLADLPPGVHLEPGRIIFDFTHPEDFWAMVDTLADIAAQDPESFAKASAALEPI